MCCEIGKQSYLRSKGNGLNFCEESSKRVNDNDTVDACKDFFYKCCDCESRNMGDRCNLER